MLDILLKNSLIVDGTGNPWFHGDIGIKDQRIVQIGCFQAEADVTIDIDGKIVCPGFIDIHSHTDLMILPCPRPLNKILQGVTTEVTGNCGLSTAPVHPETVEQLKQYLGLSTSDIKWDWSTLDEYWHKVKKQGLLTNIAPLVGQGAIRNAVMGFEQRNPTSEELGKMISLLNLAMEQGAFGLSSGLIYPPGLFSQVEEMIELAIVIQKFDGIYATHVRSETGNLLEAYREALDVCRCSGVKLQISHHKACGKRNWGKVTQTLKLIEIARQSGLDVTCDQYPYLASCTHLSAFLPPWAHEGGVLELLKRLSSPKERMRLKNDIQNRDDWENGIKEVGWDRIMISQVNNEKDKHLEGSTLQEMTANGQGDPFDSLFDLLLRTQADVRVFSFGVSEEDLCQVMKHPSTMFGTDGGASSIYPKDKPHPRNYGVYPRILGEYVREKQVITLEEAIRKMTSFPAQKLGLHDRGLLRMGNWADLVVFDPDKINDLADYGGDVWQPEGIQMVLVNGKIVVKKGIATGEAPGQVLHRGSLAS